MTILVPDVCANNMWFRRARRECFRHDWGSSLKNNQYCGQREPQHGFMFA
jgi:hypothetical protein